MVVNLVGYLDFMAIDMHPKLQFRQYKTTNLVVSLDLVANFWITKVATKSRVECIKILGAVKGVKYLQ